MRRHVVEPFVIDSRYGSFESGVYPIPECLPSDVIATADIVCQLTEDRVIDHMDTDLFGRDDADLGRFVYDV